MSEVRRRDFTGLICSHGRPCIEATRLLASDEFWVLYDHPIDFCTGFVARLWERQRPNSEHEVYSEHHAITGTFVPTARVHCDCSRRGIERLLVEVKRLEFVAPPNGSHPQILGIYV